MGRQVPPAVKRARARVDRQTRLSPGRAGLVCSCVCVRGFGPGVGEGALVGSRPGPQRVWRSEESGSC